MRGLVLSCARFLTVLARREGDGCETQETSPMRRQRLWLRLSSWHPGARDLVECHERRYIPRGGDHRPLVQSARLELALLDQKEEWPLGTATQMKLGGLGTHVLPGIEARLVPLFRYLLLDPQVARQRLRSWRCGSGADRQMAVGSPHVQDAKRGDRGRTWGTGTCERRARKALEGNSHGGHDRSDHQNIPAHAGRDCGGRAPRHGERCTHAL